LDSHQHHQRAYCPIRSHGSLDRQRNDRLGRIQRQLFEHRREILRAIWSNANSDTHTDGDTDSNSDRDSYNNSKGDTDTEVSSHASTAPVEMVIGDWWIAAAAIGALAKVIPIAKRLLKNCFAADPDNRTGL
jgi:hypothetical protein